MAKIQLITAIALLSLSACGLEDALDADLQAQDIAKCNSRGFVNGTEAMATCMATLSNERQAEMARSEARVRASEAKEAAKKQAAKQTDISGVPASNRPTAEIMGVDPGTANMTMCSDGAMREDCSFAPSGY